MLVDIVEGLPQGKALDLAEAAPVVGHDARITGTNDYADTAGSDIVVVTSGLPRQPGMSRDDLLREERGHRAAVVVEQAAAHSPNAILIVVTNPLDAMCHVALSASGFPRERVIGMAGVLDSARFRTFIARGAGRVGREHARLRARRPRRHDGAAAALLDGRRHPDHGAAAGGARSTAIVERTRNGGAEIVALLKTGSAYYAPAASVVSRWSRRSCIDRQTVLPCAALLEGEYGDRRPVRRRAGRARAGGIEQIVEIELTADEQAAFDKSAGVRPRARGEAARLGVTRRLEGRRRRVRTADTLRALWRWP